MARGSGEERRKHPRKRVRFRVRYWGDEIEGIGTTLDASASGIFIQTIKTPPKGTRIHCEITMPDGPFFADGIVARVVRVPASARSVKPNGIGVHFLTFGEVLSGQTTTSSEPRPAGLSFVLTDPARIETVISEELSKGGLFVQTGEVLEVGSKAQLTIQLPEPHEPITTEATVLQRVGIPPGVAVTIPEMEVLKEKLQEICEAIQNPGAVFRVEIASAEDLRSVYDREIRYGGLFVATDTPAALHSTVTVVIQLPEPFDGIKAEGTVVQLLDVPKGMGIQFTNPKMVSDRFGRLLAR